MSTANSLLFRTRMTRLALSMLLFGVAYAQTPNMDVGLSQIVRTYKTTFGIAPTSLPAFSYRALAQQDSQNRILVEIMLDGSLSIDQFRPILLSLGATITGENAQYRNGAISAYLPVGTIEALGSSRGVDNLSLGYKPITNAGLVTSQGAKVMRSDVVNTSGFTGKGITVGILSDSFNTLNGYSKDMATKDLPSMKFILDGSGADEGRAMAQIVYDVAPNAGLCFATAQGGLVSFANNIKQLRTNPQCAADVIVDDVAYFTEPIFADGQIAQAVNDVVTSAGAGKQVSYFSAAGNQQAASFDVTSARFVVKSTVPTVNLTTVATCPNYGNGLKGTDTGGGFLDFGGNTFTAQTNFAANSFLVMQWDDPFDLKPSGITMDLNFLLFDPSGKCLGILGADNFKTNQAVEVVGGATGNINVMIARTTASSHRPNRLRVVGFGVTSSIFGKVATPVTWGHSAAANGISVAAYRYTNAPTQQSPFIPLFEYFSSPGPVTIAIDAAGRRMSVPETRQKPDLAAPDGADTTFFGQEWEGDGYPNFFGTSAAAPHAAGVAALMLQKAGGPGTLAPALLKSYMLTSIPARVIPYSGNSTPQFGWSPYDGFGLLYADGAVTRKPAAVTLAISPTSFLAGTPVTVTVKVSGVGGTPTGLVNLTGTCGGSTYSLQIVPVAPSTFNTTLPYIACNFSIIGPQAYPVTAQYMGDGVFAPANSTPVTVSVTPNPIL